MCSVIIAELRSEARVGNNTTKKSFMMQVPRCWNFGEMCMWCISKM